MDINQRQRYDNLDGLRAFSAIGIVLMHVLANSGIEAQGFVFTELIPSFTNLVFLFMIISGFSMCCGYFEGISTGSITPEKFYKKRYSKVWLFFGLLCLLDLAVAPSKESLYEVFANLTLCFGLIPDHGISVIGVGWFLGVAFVFYFLFPFICFLLANKKRAWMAFVIALLLNYVCAAYFNQERTSFLYCAVFFLAGGMLYLYRVQLQYFANRFGWLVILVAGMFTAVYFLVSANVVVMLLLYGTLVLYALNSKQRRFSLLSNPATKFLSGISMEIYLSHMVIFRIIEKLLGRFLEKLPELLHLVLLAAGTLMGAILFSWFMHKGISFVLAQDWKNRFRKIKG